mmetsp:Transcript_58171/g.173054  ORF Transcript_58171/g.173054 Transcript_58171/m.173054 type:complete len:235 (+) Transcript_58171:280-984(+)
MGEAGREVGLPYPLCPHAPHARPDVRAWVLGPDEPLRLAGGPRVCLSARRQRQRGPAPARHLQRDRGAAVEERHGDGGRPADGVGRCRRSGEALPARRGAARRPAIGPRGRLLGHRAPAVPSLWQQPCRARHYGRAVAEVLRQDPLPGQGHGARARLGRADGLLLGVPPDGAREVVLDRDGHREADGSHVLGARRALHRSEPVWQDARHLGDRRSGGHVARARRDPEARGVVQK